MSKLAYRTKAPRKGYTFMESNTTHQTVSGFFKPPKGEIQEKALELVSDRLHELIRELEDLGYDPTKVRF